MKKLTTLFILVFLAVGLFAEPKVPKLYNGDDYYTYISNDFKYSYNIIANKVDTPKFNYRLTLGKTSLESNKKINLIIYFENEAQLDNFSNKIKLEDIEDEFTRIQKLVIKSGSTPNESHGGIDFSNPPALIYYNADGTKLKY